MGGDARPAPHRHGCPRARWGPIRRGRPSRSAPRSSRRSPPSIASRCAGRDSAGLTVLVRDHGLDLADPAVARLIAARADDHLFRSNAVRTPEGHLCFVYKAAAEIGELGDNTAAMRADLLADDLLRLALAGERAAAARARPHPLGEHRDHQPAQRPPRRQPRGRGRAGPFVTAALNGDVDNFADLKAAGGLRLAAEITTDAKVIPTLVSHRLAEGADLTTAFRDTVASFEGSVAIAASAASHPDHLLLALRGSGQALYVGLADDCYVVASEPYGLVELTSRYVRLDGDTPANPENPNASRGQIVVLDGSTRRHARRDRPPGLRRHARSRSPTPTSRKRRSPPATSTAARTRTSSSRRSPRRPTSFRKTLRGKLVDRDGALHVVAGRRRARPRRARAPAQRSHRPHPGDRSGHRPRGGPEPGDARCSRASPTAASASRRSPPPSSPASGCGPT